MALRIVRLAEEHCEALKSFVSEFSEAGEAQIPAYFAADSWSIHHTVRVFSAWEHGEELANGWVPSTTLFLVDGQRILGVTNVRHRLTAALRREGGHVGYSVRPSERGKGYATILLRAAIQHAYGLGIHRLLVTCRESNLASARVIEKCGGVPSEPSVSSSESQAIKRFWIEWLRPPD